LTADRIPATCGRRLVDRAKRRSLNRPEDCPVLAYDMCKPADWQEFERATCVLVRCVLGDPNAQPNGRQGQAQAGVDICGTRASDGARVGVQCKKRVDAPVTDKELTDELAKALTFNPPVDEFVLATTASRDAAIQEAARLLTEAASGTSRPVKVAVWGWQDIEEHARAHVEAQQAFDPTFSPYAANMHKDLADRIDALSIVPAASHSPRDVRLLERFEALLTPGLLDWLREHDFGAPVQVVLLDPIVEFADTWRGASYEFVDDDLQTSFAKVWTSARNMARLAAAELYWLRSSMEWKTVKDERDQAAGYASERAKASAAALNEAATALSSEIDGFLRLARKRIAS
jgi:hypothetical protein